MDRSDGSARDRDSEGRPQQARPRDVLGRPLPRHRPGVEPLPDPLPTDPAVAVSLAQSLLDAGRPFQAHEVLEALWRTCAAEQRGLWQGLAQLVVAITHAERGNATGARRLLHRAAARLGDLAPRADPPLDGPAIAAWLAAALEADRSQRSWWDRRLVLMRPVSGPSADPADGRRRPQG